MPPSTSRSHSGLIRSDHLADTPDLLDCRVNETLMAETWVDRHDQDLVHVLQDFFENRGGAGWVNGYSDALVEGFHALHGTRQIVVAFPVDQKRIRAGLAKLIEEKFGGGDHEVGFQRQTGHPPQR